MSQVDEPAPSADGRPSVDEASPNDPLHPLWELIEDALSGDKELDDLSRTAAERAMREGTPSLPPPSTLRRWAAEDPQLHFAHALLQRADHMGEPVAAHAALVRLSRALIERNGALDDTDRDLLEATRSLETEQFVEQLGDYLVPKPQASVPGDHEGLDRRVFARTLLYLHAIAKQMQPSELVRHLDALFWSSHARGSLPRSKRAALFGSTTDLALGATAESFATALGELEEERSRVERERQGERDRVNALEAELVESQERVRTLEQRVSRQDSEALELNRRLEEAERRTTETRTHASSDYESLRARTGRQLRAQEELLSELRSALDRDPPKVAIASERAEELSQQLARMFLELEAGR